jgi:hypothetical protein
MFFPKRSTYRLKAKILFPSRFLLAELLKIMCSETFFKSG